MTHLQAPEWRGSDDPRTGKTRLFVHVLQCNGCGTEHWNDGYDSDYRQYVPDAWVTRADGKHVCPDCISRAITGHTVHCLTVGEEDYCHTPAACEMTAKLPTAI